jgi:hypothetical protein
MQQSGGFGTCNPFPNKRNRGSNPKMSHGSSGSFTYAPEASRRQSWYFGVTNLRVAWERPAQAKVDSAAAMTEQEESELRAQLARLRQEHRDLDAAIEALQIAPGADILQIQRLKKRKLVLRDRISFIEDQLTPDIIA